MIGFLAIQRGGQSVKPGFGDRWAVLQSLEVMSFDSSVLSVRGFVERGADHVAIAQVGIMLKHFIRDSLERLELARVQEEGSPEATTDRIQAAAHERSFSRS